MRSHFRAMNNFHVTLSTDNCGTRAHVANIRNNKRKSKCSRRRIGRCEGKLPVIYLVIDFTHPLYLSADKNATFITHYGQDNLYLVWSLSKDFYQWYHICLFEKILHAFSSMIFNTISYSCQELILLLVVLVAQLHITHVWY